MRYWRKFPKAMAAFVLLGLLVAGEIWALAQGIRTSRIAQKKLDRVGREWRSVASTDPAPTPANAARIEEELAYCQQSVREQRLELTDGEPTVAQVDPELVPKKQTEAYFAIAAFVERMRERAEGAGIRVQENESFGFGGFTSEVPEEAEMARVHREFVVAERLLEILFAAGPRELLSVQREVASGRSAHKGVSPSTRTAAKAARVGAVDTFVLDPGCSVRRLGRVSTTALRLVFDAQTAVLRRFLNGLVAAEGPLIVRLVEVGPADTKPSKATGDPREVAPVVAPTWLRFVVVVESVELEDIAVGEG